MHSDRAELLGLKQRLEQAEALPRHHPAHAEQLHKALGDLLEYYDFNTSFLTPYFWPHYPRNKPLVYTDYPFAIELFKIQFGGFTVIRGSRQISKSTTLCARQQMLARMLRGFKTLYITPRHDQLRTYQSRFRDMEHANRFFKPDSTLRQNLGFKEFLNGSSVDTGYALTTAAGIRGRSCDELLLDEAQHLDPELELEILQTLSASKMKILIYAGTSLTSDTLLEDRWAESSQGSWVMKCSGCNHYNFPLLDRGVMDMIQAKGPSCAKCGKLLNVREGQWVHAFPGNRDAGLVGYHVPKLIVPALVSDPLTWAEIYRQKAKVGSSRQFIQEVLGIATEEGEREITRKHLEAICTLGSNLEHLRLRATQKAYKWVISGCDWGGSDYIPELKIKKSTTVHVIAGVLPTGEFDILHIRRYGGMNYDDIVGDILHNHAAYGGFAMASDFGVGAVYNSKLRQKVSPQRHLIFCYTGPTTRLMAEPEGNHQFNQWSLNKTESISLTFEALRQRRIRCFAWEIAQEYLQDALNLFRAPGEKGQSGSGAGSGATTFIYRSHATRPNDTLMSVNYCYMLGKILLGEPMMADLAMKALLEGRLMDFDTIGLCFPNLPGAFSE